MYFSRCHLRLKIMQDTFSNLFIICARLVMVNVLDHALCAALELMVAASTYTVVVLPLSGWQESEAFDSLCMQPKTL